MQYVLCSNYVFSEISIAFSKPSESITVIWKGSSCNEPVWSILEHCVLVSLFNYSILSSFFKWVKTYLWPISQHAHTKYTRVNSQIFTFTRARQYQKCNCRHTNNWQDFTVISYNKMVTFCQNQILYKKQR